MLAAEAGHQVELIRRKIRSSSDVKKSVEMVADQAQLDADLFLVPAVKLRRLNRLSNFQIRLMNEKLAQAQSQVDARHLSLQNIVSETAHLRKQIDACLEFTLV
jgi:hypothetical protein